MRPAAEVFSEILSSSLKACHAAKTIDALPRRIVDPSVPIGDGA